jgi:hypothetical protein
LDALDDVNVLALAASENRILVSHDVNKMPKHFRDFCKHSPSPGVFLIPQDYPIGSAVQSLILAWEASTSDDWNNRVCLIPSMVAIVI